MDGRTSPASRRAIFLDRDGTITIDTGYPADPGEVELLPGAAHGLRTLGDRGWALVLVSNQSGVGRGMITPEQAQAVHDRLMVELRASGVELDGAYYCPHSPEDDCECRKPRSGLLRRAAAELRLDLAGSVMVGDRQSDVEAGRGAGCRTVLLGSGEGDPDVRAADWAELVTTVTDSPR
jgi:D-glycero-D-manno-heptose 1,7-bisphosphate phosphatase